MKQITITALFVMLSLFAFSQSKFQAGAYAEGGWFMPDGGNATLENGMAVGGGLFASYPIAKMFSASLGAGYRYKTNERIRTLPLEEGEYGSQYGSGGYDKPGYYQVTDEFPQHYIVVPLKFQFTPKEKLFFEAGIESAWLLNYDDVWEKPELNWTIGAGYQFTPRFKASLSYMQGFKDQGFGDKLDGVSHIQEIYKNRMATLNVSYAIFGGK